MLHASHRVYRVEVTETQPIPAIELLRNPFRPSDQLAEISVISLSSVKSSLVQNDPIFGYLSNISPLRFSPRSFCIDQLQPKFKPKQQEERAQPPPSHAHSRSFDLVAPELGWDLQWRSLATKLSSPGLSGPRSILVCGTEGNGKSLFSKLLANNFLSGRFTSSGIAFIDLDPAHPEYTPPGCVSLLHIKDLNLEPSFTHPWPIGSTGNRILRCHFVDFTLQQDELRHYLECSKNLFEHWQTALLGEACPLIIKCCDWTHETRHNTSIALIGALRPSDVVVIDDQYSDKLIRVFQDGCSQTGSKLHSLSGHNMDFRLGDASAELCDLQFHSYFHLPTTEGCIHQCYSTLLNHGRVTGLFYGGLYGDIAGFLFFGDEINNDMLHDAVKGTVFAVVAHEDMSTRSQDPQSFNPIRPSSRSPEIRESNQHEARLHYHFPQYTSCENFYIRETKQGLPIVSSSSGFNRPLDPTTTHCLGLVIVQAIDTQTRQLTVFTPISQQTLSYYRDASIPLLLAKQQNYPRNFDDTIYEPTLRSAEKGSTRMFSSRADKYYGIESRLRGLSKPMFVENGKADGRNLISSKSFCSKVTVHKKNSIWRVRRNLKAPKDN